VQTRLIRWLIFATLTGIFVFSWLNLSATIWIVDFPNLSQEIRNYDKIVMNTWEIVTVLSFVGGLTILFLNIRWHRKQARPGPLRNSNAS
jgi:hypothetical protein